MLMKKEKFLEIINDILANKSIQNLKLYKHHYAYTRLEHCLSVSYYTYVICKFLHLDYKSAARAALLHDLFFYDCEDKISRPKNHIKNHPKIALENANKLFNLNKKEQDIILKHMWPLTFSPPKYLESFMNENELSFNEFFDRYRVKHIVTREDYIELKNRKNKIYT